MPANKKSAKDIAFDRERNEYKKKIKELESIIKCKNSVIRSLIDDKNSLLSDITVKDEWIDRLLEFTELSRDELKMLTNDRPVKDKWLGNLLEFPELSRDELNLLLGATKQSIRSIDSVSALVEGMYSYKPLIFGGR